MNYEALGAASVPIFAALIGYLLYRQAIKNKQIKENKINETK